MPARAVRTVRGHVRSRLQRSLGRLERGGLGLIVAPAGSGKTTALAHFAAMTDSTVVWCQPTADNGEPCSFLASLHQAAQGETVASGPWTTVQEAAMALAGQADGRLLIVVDDVHLLEETPAERTLSELALALPSGVALLLAGRRPPGFDFSHWRLDDRLLELGSNELRFRTWEVEELFERHHGHRLAPQDLAEVTRRTGGWAAGLQFFYLAMRGKPAGQVRRLLRDLGGSAAWVNEYLAHNVAQDLPPELTEFMILTSPLGWLTGRLCDAFLDRTGSQALLTEADGRQVFTECLEDGGYRYHEVWRSYLDQALIDLVGEASAQEEHRRAGELLREAGRPTEAAVAYCRSEDWEALDLLIADEAPNGRHTVDLAGVSLPPPLQHESWALLAAARRLVRQGRIADAMVRYQEAENVCTSRTRADVCKRERMAVAHWAGDRPAPGGGWSGTLRRALCDRPVEALPGLRTDPIAGLVVGLVALLAGDVQGATERLTDVSDNLEASSLVSSGALVGLAFAAVLQNRPTERDALEWAVEVLESEVPWLARLANALLSAGTVEGVKGADSARLHERACGNMWGASLAAVTEVLLWLAAPDQSEVLTAGDAAEIADGASIDLARLGAPVLVAWAEAAAGAVRRRAGLSRSSWPVGGPGRSMVIELAELPLLQPSPRGPSEHLVFDRRGRGGVTVRCLGGLEVAVDGRHVDTTSVKPRARSLLRLLALHAGRPVHREALVEALWPEQTLAAATRSLQVAVSSLRRLLYPDARCPTSPIAREEDCYRLVVGPDGEVDVVLFERSLAAGRFSLHEGDFRSAAKHLEEALSLYQGDLFPEEGTSEWVVKDRHHLLMGAANAASDLAECRLELGDPTGAMLAINDGLRFDPFHDGLWRQRIEAAERAGDRLAATHARAEYRLMLSDLGLASEAVG